MHIALVSPAWPPGRVSNGIVTYVAGLQRGLVALGHRVSVITPQLSAAAASDDESGHVYQIPPERPKTISTRLERFLRPGTPSPDLYAQRLIRTVNALHEREPLDIIEMEETFGICGDLAAAVSIPVVAKLHGPAFLDLVGEARDTPFAVSRIETERVGLRRVQFITSPASSTLEAAVAEYRLHPKQMQVIFNPMEFDDRAGPWNAETCEPETLLFVGRFDQRKGGDVALLLLQALLKKRPQLRLVFIGPNRGWVTHDGRTVKFDDFAAQALTPAERERVRYLDQLPREQVFAWRQRATLTLVLSCWDNQPNTALEAMMQGCPVVALATGGVPEIIEHERTGLLAAAGNLNELAAQCLRVLDDSELRRRLGTHARECIRQRHAPDHIATETAAFYARCLAA